jgi:uncharacterized glyoxalase superfamily protein PhnB
MKSLRSIVEQARNAEEMRNRTGHQELAIRGDVLTFDSNPAQYCDDELAGLSSILTSAEMAALQDPGT